MRLEAPAGTHLTYCTNVHPGEAWAAVEQTLETHVRGVKALVAPNAPFGVGLRLAASACDELSAPGVLERTRADLDAAGLYVFTLNGFPYGAFHGTRVKERVYRPDWLEAERVSYTIALARVLAVLIPDGVPGSISTVPGCFVERAEAGAGRRIAHNVASAAAELVRIERSSGCSLSLALEPEPACLLETSADAIRFFEEELFAREVVESFAKTLGETPARAETLLRTHVGVCLDTCHASVEFERPIMALQKLSSAGIAVPKIQLSAGLRVAPATREALERLRDFDDGVYLHQTVVRPGSELEAPARRLQRFLDLPDALAAASGGDAEWRVHFHVPIFRETLGIFSSTQDDLRELLALGSELSPHLEVETYTFGVLPDEFRDRPVTEAVAAELAWVLGVLSKRTDRFRDG